MLDSLTPEFRHGLTCQMFARNVYVLICVVLFYPVWCTASGYTPPFRKWESVPSPPPVEPLPDPLPQPSDTDDKQEGVVDNSVSQAGKSKLLTETTQAPDDDTSTGHIIGASVGIAVLLLVATAIALYFWRKHRKRQANTYCVAAQEDHFIQLKKNDRLGQNGMGPISDLKEGYRNKNQGHGSNHGENEDENNIDTVPIMAFSVSDSLEDRDRSMGESCTPRSPLAPAAFEIDMQHPSQDDSIIRRTPKTRSPISSEGSQSGSRIGSQPGLGRGEVWTESQVLEILDEEDVFLRQGNNDHLKYTTDDGKSNHSEEVFVDAPSPSSSMELVSSSSHADQGHADQFGSTDTFRSAASHFGNKRKSWMSSGEVIFEDTL